MCVDEKVLHSKQLSAAAVMAPSFPGGSEMGYEVVLIFLYLPNAEIAIKRVRERVRQGGHYVPEEVIRRRYEGGWKNFKLFYKRLVDYWLLYDNSGKIPMLLSEGQKS